MSEEQPPTQDSGSLTNEEKQARLWGMLCRLTALSLLISLPFGNILCPLVIWLIKRNEIPFVDEQGKESLNFQISMTIYALVAALLMLVIIGFFLLIGLAVFSTVMVIIASIKANDGVVYKYPVTIRILK